MSQKDDRLVQLLQGRYTVRADGTLSPDNVVDLRGEPVLTEAVPEAAREPSPPPISCHACHRLFPQVGENARKLNVDRADSCRRYDCPMRSMLARLRPT